MALFCSRNSGYRLGVHIARESYNFGDYILGLRSKLQIGVQGARGLGSFGEAPWEHSGPSTRHINTSWLESRLLEADHDRAPPLGVLLAYP